MFNRKKVKELERCVFDLEKRIFTIENPSKYRVGANYNGVLIMGTRVIFAPLDYTYRPSLKRVYDVYFNKTHGIVADFEMSELIKNGFKNLGYVYLRWTCASGFEL